MTELFNSFTKLIIFKAMIQKKKEKKSEIHKQSYYLLCEYAIYVMCEDS